MKFRVESQNDYRKWTEIIENAIGDNACRVCKDGINVELVVD